jgi:hypothetical protein
MALGPNHKSELNPISFQPKDEHQIIKQIQSNSLELVTFMATATFRMFPMNNAVILHYHDPVLITVTGLDYDCFTMLLALFGLYFHNFTPWTMDGQIQPKSDLGFGGRKRIIDEATCLALALTYTHTRGSMFMLQAFFGQTAMPLVTWSR